MITDPQPFKTMGKRSRKLARRLYPRHWKKVKYIGGYPTRWESNPHYHIFDDKNMVYVFESSFPDVVEFKVSHTPPNYNYTLFEVQNFMRKYYRERKKMKGAWRPIRIISN